MKRPAAQRRGTLYVAVLGVSLLVGVMALTASTVGRATLRAAASGADARRAAVHARSGIEYALYWLNQNEDWRTTLTSGAVQDAVFPSRSGEGSFTWSVADADGDLADDPRDHAVLRVVGRAGSARVVLEAAVEPRGRGLTCLEAALHATDDIDVDGTITGAGILSSAKKIRLHDATCNLDAEATDKTEGKTYNGSRFDNAPLREAPGEHALDWYVRVGTEIPIADLPKVFSQRYFDLRLLSRELNPFGDPNPRGIYWIDCEGESVDIRYSRVVGTLVLLNAGPTTEFGEVNLLQAAAANQPVLLVDGDLRVDLRGFLSGQQLHELGTRNFNPPEAPYEGASDNDQDDSYPTKVEGLVYATGAIHVADDSIVEGSLIADGGISVASDKTLTIDYRPYSLNYPPPGFSAGVGVRLLPGTIRRVAF